MSVKVPKYRELRIKRTPEGIVVDFFPDMFVKATHEKEPTETNPDVKLDLGTVGGKVVPLKAYYPPEMTEQEIMDRLDLLFEKVEWCPGCERKKRLVLGKLKKFMEQRGHKEVFEKVLTAPKPSEPVPEHRRYKMQQEAGAGRKPLEQRMQENVAGAIDNVYVAVRGFFVPPVRPVRPDDWLRVVSGK